MNLDNPPIPSRIKIERQKKGGTGVNENSEISYNKEKSHNDIQYDPLITVASTPENDAKLTSANYPGESNSRKVYRTIECRD